MDEPQNSYGVGQFRGRVAIERPVHRMMSQQQALELAYWLIHAADDDRPFLDGLRSQILNHLIMRGKPKEED